MLDHEVDMDTTSYHLVQTKVNIKCIYTVAFICTGQCWTEGRSSTAVAEDFRPTATVAEV